MIQIKYKGLDRNIKTAADNMNTLFGYSGFYDAIKRHLKFDMANVPPSWIADLIKSSNIEMSVDFYYSVNPFSDALSYDDLKNPSVIRLNKWNLHKSLGSLCNAMMHQCVHAVNAQYPQYAFGHGSDIVSEGKNNTAPYWIANLAQQIILKDDSIAESLCHELVINIPENVQMSAYR
jgi:hypothetical protein